MFAVSSFNEAAVHHGGSDRSLVPHIPRLPRFNEAAVHHGGSGRCATRSKSSAPELQRGRRSSRRIGPRSLRLPNGTGRFNEAAVHHGGSGTRSPFGSCPLSRFNEAAVHHGGSVRRIHRCRSTNEGFNEAAVHHGGSADRCISSEPHGCQASTRPPFITADRSLEAAQKAATSTALQRGRRSSRRIG